MLDHLNFVIIKRKRKIFIFYFKNFIKKIIVSLLQFSKDEKVTEKKIGWEKPINVNATKNVKSYKTLGLNLDF